MLLVKTLHVLAFVCGTTTETQFVMYTTIFASVVSEHFTHIWTHVSETSLLKIRTDFVHKGANSCLFFDTNHSKHVLPNHNHVDRSPTLVLLSLYNVSCLFRVTTLSVSMRFQ